MYRSVYSALKGTLLRRPMMQKLHLFPDDVRSLWYWLYYFVNTYNKCCFWEIWNPKKLLIFVAFSLLHYAHSHVTLCNWLSLKHGLDGLPITALAYSKLSVRILSNVCWWIKKDWDQSIVYLDVDFSSFQCCILLAGWPEGHLAYVCKESCTIYPRPWQFSPRSQQKVKG